MRTRDEISKDIAYRVNVLNELVEISIRDEQKNEKRRSEIKDEIKNLREEVSFDDTLAGFVHRFTQETTKKVDVLFDELEQKTGVDLVVVLKHRSELKKDEKRVQDHRNVFKFYAEVSPWYAINEYNFNYDRLNT